jgi:hypothetical protein
MLTLARGARYRQPEIARQPEFSGINKASRAIQGAVYYTNLQDYSWTNVGSNEVATSVRVNTNGRAKYTIVAGVEGGAAVCAWVDKPLANVADPERLIVLTGAAMLDQPFNIMTEANEQVRAR